MAFIGVTYACVHALCGWNNTVQCQQASHALRFIAYELICRQTQVLLLLLLLWLPLMPLMQHSAACAIIAASAVCCNPDWQTGSSYTQQGSNLPSNRSAIQAAAANAIEACSDESCIPWLCCASNYQTVWL